MKKKVFIILITIIILILLSYGAFVFIIGFKEDQKATKDKMNIVINTYNDFNNKVLEFAKGRDYLYTQMEDTYLVDYAKDVNKWNELIKQHQDNIKAIEKVSKPLKENCQIEYVDPNVSSKCTIFKSTYEAANNYFITDIKAYNKNVEKYNEWATINNKDKLKKGKLVVYHDYIDYDKDKEYFGKEGFNND